jgi:hypothetical protein
VPRRKVAADPADDIALADADVVVEIEDRRQRRADPVGERVGGRRHRQHGDRERRDPSPERRGGRPADNAAAGDDDSFGRRAASGPSQATFAIGQ